jgi:prepilin-type N-terminal cleavage/methylation domain-containing protein
MGDIEIMRRVARNLRCWLHRHGRCPNDDGLTLVELIVVIAIIPLVVGAVSVALITVISQTNTATAKTTDSGDATVVSANFGPDVLGSSEVTTYSGSPALTPPICGGGSTVVSLQWGTSPTVTSYSVQSQVLYHKTSWVLYRYECFGNSTTPSSSVVVAHNVQNPSGPTPLTATISGSSTSCPTPNAANCAQGAAKTDWISTQGVSGVSITVKALELGPTYTYTLSAVPRASSNASRSSTSPGNPADPLMVLGTTGSLDCGNATLNVNGGVDIWTNSGNTATSTGPNGSINSTTGINTNGTLSGTTTVNGSPVSTSSGPPTLSNPYANLTPPSSAGLQTFSSNSSSSGPGIYTNGLSLSGTLKSGLYIVQNGDVSASGTVTSTTAGVLIYIENGAWTESGGTTVTLYAWTSPLSPAPGMVLWEAASDAHSGITLSTNGNDNDTFYGTVYLASPTSSTNMVGQHAFNAGALIASTITCGNGSPGTVNIGPPY